MTFHQLTNLILGWSLVVLVWAVIVAAPTYMFIRTQRTGRKLNLLDKAANKLFGFLCMLALAAVMVLVFGIIIDIAWHIAQLHRSAL